MHKIIHVTQYYITLKWPRYIMPPRFPQFVRIGEILSIVRQTWRGGNIYITCTRGHRYDKVIVYNPRPGAINLHISTNCISCFGWNKSNIRDGGVLSNKGVFTSGRARSSLLLYMRWSVLCVWLAIDAEGRTKFKLPWMTNFEYWGQVARGRQWSPPAMAYVGK